VCVCVRVRQNMGGGGIMEFRLERMRKIMENGSHNIWCPTKFWSWYFQKANL